MKKKKSCGCESGCCGDDRVIKLFGDDSPAATFQRELYLRQERHTFINKKELLVKKRKDYAELVTFGDLHFGHPNCLVDRAKEMIDYCLAKGIYVLLMGDLLECGITGAVGDSVYSQNLEPQKQMEGIVYFLEPLAKAGLILGLMSGNHEARIYKTTGIDIAKIMADSLEVPYMYMAGWNHFTVGGQEYKIYALHGASGSKFIYTKLKAATDIAHYFDCDVLCMGHVHDIASVAIEEQLINGSQVEYRKKYILLTGHYLGYDLSYAQAKGFPPSKVGSPKIKLFSKKKSVHISY